MSDITKCSGEDCLLASTCYRHNAISGMLQSWFFSNPHDSSVELKSDHSNAQEYCTYYLEDSITERERLENFILHLKRQQKFHEAERYEFRLSEILQSQINTDGTDEVD